LIETDTDTKTLVLLDDWATTESHSMFFDHVRTNLGHQVEFSMIKDGAQASGTKALEKEGIATFDNIVLMAPST